MTSVRACHTVATCPTSPVERWEVPHPAMKIWSTDNLCRLFLREAKADADATLHKASIGAADDLRRIVASQQKLAFVRNRQP